MKKKKDLAGQLPLDGVEASLDDAILKSDKPRGLPALSAIRAEVKKYGLLDSDAEHMHDIWCMNGFTLKGGKKVQDWKAAVRVWHRNEYFPSQRKPSGIKTTAWQPPTLEEVFERALELQRDKDTMPQAARRRAKRLAQWCYDHWVGAGWTRYGQPIKSAEQWKALMVEMREEWNKSEK